MSTTRMNAPEVRILVGDCRKMLKTIPDESIHCAITSPPYWGLRDYSRCGCAIGTVKQDNDGNRTHEGFNERWRQSWEPSPAPIPRGIPDPDCVVCHGTGKDDSLTVVWDAVDGCEHEWGDEVITKGQSGGKDNPFADKLKIKGVENYQERSDSLSAFCLKCGAWRGQLGLEPTPDLYVKHLVQVFREVWRVLRDDGTLWCNMGDCYASNAGGNRGVPDEWARAGRGESASVVHEFLGLKPKDMVGMPWRVAFALQQPYVVPVCVKEETDRAWLAAMFDGEGCIGIRRYDSYRAGAQYQDGFVAYTVVTNNDVELLERCVSITGKGKVALKQKAESTDRRGIVSRRDSYGWRLDGNGAIDVIRAIYPYLIAKRKQAQLAFTLDTINKDKHRVDGKVPKEDQGKKAFCYESIKACNQRQSVTLPKWIQEPTQKVEDGWYLRSDIIWVKPNPMPESVTDRPTKAHEYVFLLTKEPQYFYDSDAIREGASASSIKRWKGDLRPHNPSHGSSEQSVKGEQSLGTPSSGRNLRTVWTIPTQPYKNAHFATFPEKLVEPCIKAGTSEKGCCATCGAPWGRVVEKSAFPERIVEPGGKQNTQDAHFGHRRIAEARNAARAAGMGHDGYFHSPKTIGFRPTCDHGGDPVPCVVLDPFAGSGTVGEVARNLGRSAILIEVKEEYATMARARCRTNLRPIEEFV